jgi:serine/threonine protein kinase
MDTAAKFAMYEDLLELGRGTTGVVYRAKDTYLGRVVALKVLLPVPEANYPEQAARFLREARVLASFLAEPGTDIPSINQVGECNGRPYYARELVEGVTLQQRLASSTIDLVTGLRVLRRIAQVLHWVHGRGLVHRNLHPANILVGTDDGSKLIGFGLVGLLEGSPLVRSGGRGVSVAVDLRALQGMVLWLCRGLREPVPKGLQRLQQPSSCETAAVLEQILANYLQEVS